MRIIVRALALAGLAFGTAFAAVPFNFAAATDGSYHCQNYCMGFTTDNGVDTVEYVFIQATPGTPAGNYRVTISIDQVYYQGYTNDPTQPFIVSSSTTGGSYTVTVNYTTQRKCVTSGRGQHCTTYIYPNSGSVSQ